MGNILIFSDLHINDYPHRNPSYRYRLYQTRIVAQNIIKVAQQYGADTVFIAGDLIHKSVMRPYIMAEVKGFLDTLMGYFKTGRIIYGNHDLDSKLPNQDPSDCILSVMLPPNLKYCDRTVEKFGKSMIAFSNWRQGTIDLSFIRNPVDFLITHATIAYSDTDFFPSCQMDESKFGLCFSGDIHKRAVRGKYVSLGIPQRCSMGDSPECSGVILDPVKKMWMPVNLNPDDNLLKFEYTKDRRLEGYRQDSNTWYVYQPDKSIVPGQSSVSTKLWAEVDTLINDVIQRENLTGLHSEVLRRLPQDIDELDLGFVLTGFRCSNWRSIDYLDIKINPGDRIILHGQNGSGKSSILSALKCAFIESPRGLKNYVCNKGTSKNCWTEVDFLYQGHQYTLRRGTGTDNSGKCWGLQIDGVQQPYPNVTSFNADVSRRFPFLSVLEYFYFDDSHARFLGDMKNEEKPLLIAKLLKLHKIDIYHDAAENILQDIRKSNEAWTFKKVDVQGRLGRLDAQRASLRVPGKPKEVLLSEREEGYELQRKANLWLEYQMKVSDRSGKMELLQQELTEITKKLSDIGSLGNIMSQLATIQGELSDLRAKESGIVNLGTQLRNLRGQLSDINTEGTRIWTEWSNLKPDVCPTCGQQIGTEVYNRYRSELEGRMTELQGKQQTITKYIESLKFNQGELDSVKAKIRDLSKEEQRLHGIKIDLENSIRRRDQIQETLATLKSDTGVSVIPEKVVMPGNSLQIMSAIESDLAAWTRIDDLNAEEQRLRLELAEADTELSKTSSYESDLLRYIGITSAVGEIYTEVLSRVATEFSDNHVYYEASKFTFRKKEHLDLVSYYIGPDGKRVMYDSASSGQKTMMDLHIMSKLAEGLGLIVFDEFLKSLDPGNHDEMLTLIKDMKIGAILLVSHQEGISGFQNKTMELELGQDGMTKVQFL